MDIDTRAENDPYLVKDCAALRIAVGEGKRLVYCETGEEVGSDEIDGMYEWAKAGCPEATGPLYGHTAYNFMMPVKIYEDGWNFRLVTVADEGEADHD